MHFKKLTTAALIGGAIFAVSVVVSNCATAAPPATVIQPPVVGKFDGNVGTFEGPDTYNGIWEEIWPGPAMKLVGPLAARSPGLRLGLALEIERNCSADEILQGRLINLVAFVDVDGAPGIPIEAGVE